MGLKNVIGVRVGRVQIRKNNRTFYYGGKWHRNTGMSFFQIDCGEGFFVIRGRRIVAKRGDIVFCEEGAFQEYRSVAGRPISYAVLGFEAVDSDGRTLKLSDLGLPFHIRPKKPGAVRALIRRIHAAFHSRREEAALECSRLGLSLLKLLSQGQKSPRQKWNVPWDIDPRIDEVLAYLDANYKKRVDVRSLASRACLHPVHFARLFKKTTGLLPARFVTEYKIRRAKDFLLSYDEPFLNAGEELGFHDYSHFYRTFKRVTGMTPSEYVRRHKKT